jgi:Na+/H+ antiporter NhaC
MNMQDSIFSLLPPLLAISIALWRKNAILALFCGVYLTFVLLEQGQIFTAAIDTASGVVQVLASTSNRYIVGFSLLIGALVALLNASGAVQGFINQLARLNWVRNDRQAALLPTIIGTSIFTDTNLSMFTGGMASQQLFDRYGLSRARLAYLLDSTCSPVSILILINGWGAYILGLLDGYQLENTTNILLGTIGYNFYAIIALLLAYYTAISGKVFGLMKHSEQMAISSSVDISQQKTTSAWFMWLPMITLLAVTFVLLWITGEGDIRQGSGSFAVFYAVVSALVLLIILCLVSKSLTLTEIGQWTRKGIWQMFPAVSILVLSFAFGNAIKLLGTGEYVSQLLSGQFPLSFIAPILFTAGAIMSFATGTSWGTFAMLIPIAIPLAQSTQLPIEFLVAAVLSGGIFGDHASPISDSTVVASIASGCDHVEHVKTQLLYALFAALLSLILFFITGWYLL